MKDFFISYNKHDRNWAEWIAWELEEAGFSVVIQAWDFTGGNWVMQMRQAMKTTQKTIAVLSPNYLDAAYTQTELNNAFLQDPKGEKDLLIPVRVVDFEPNEIFAQLLYVDFVGVNKEEAKDRLIKRVRGGRGKPIIQPVFPGGQVISQRLITQEPPFPAKAQDDEKKQRVRDIVIRWRGLYATKVDSLRKAGEQCRNWMNESPAPFSDDLIQVLTLAEAVARDFQKIPLDELEYATSYGLNIHRTVFWGQAITDALNHSNLLDPKIRADLEAYNQLSRELGLLTELGRLDSDNFEQLARLLNSALDLTQFDISVLPGGYLAEPNQSIPGDLGRNEQLLVATWNRKPGLHILPIREQLKPIGSFFARQLELTVLCAQRNTEGSLDLVAQDDQHVYYWSRSGQQPVMQFDNPESILCGRFLSTTPGSEVVLIDRVGNVRIVSADGREESKPNYINGYIDNAQCWIDPFNPKDWYVMGLGWTGNKVTGQYVVSGLHGFAAPTFSATDLWNQAILYPPQVFSGAKDPSIYWNSISSLTLTILDGLPCAVVERQASWGTGLCFLDPKTLVQLRRPSLIPHYVSGIVIAAGRWLLTTLTQYGPEIKGRIMVWDLRAADDEPLGSWLAERGDVYYPVVIAEDANSFQTLQVLRQFDPSSDSNFQLCRFHWPSGTVDRLDCYSRLQIWPVNV